MKKKQSSAFGKKVYLMGTIDDRFIWLEHPSWDCSHYWGFGYLEEYTNHINPSLANDIAMHAHYDSGKNKLENRTHDIVKMDLLFADFYKWRKEADLLFSGFYGSERKEINKEESLRINKEILPYIMAEIVNMMATTKITPESLIEMVK